jgi:hypothetical protein
MAGHSSLLLRRLRKLVCDPGICVFLAEAPSRRGCHKAGHDDRDDKPVSPHPRALAALAFDDVVALLDQALAFAILALLLLLDVRALFIVHAIYSSPSNVDARSRDIFCISHTI